MKVIFATGNQEKLREIRGILGEEAEVIGMREAGFSGEIREDGSSFSENALIKARAIGPRQDAIVMADDSGLEIQALGWEPGIRSARYLGEDTPQEEKNASILSRLSGLRGEQRYARFVCDIAVLFPDGESIVTEGVMEGRISESPAGKNGFGYDPVFYLPGLSKTAAELTEEEKNRLSHRGQALRKALQEIRNRAGENL